MRHLMGVAFAASFILLVIACQMNVDERQVSGASLRPNASSTNASSTVREQVSPEPPSWRIWPSRRFYPHEHRFILASEPEQRARQEPVNECQMSAASLGHVSPGPPYFVEYPRDYKFIVDEPEQCKQREPLVVVIVPVHPGDRASRDTIRRMWGGDTQSPVLGQRVSLFFLMGLPTGERAEEIEGQVLEESRDHRDLLQSDFSDTYNNLTIKTMLMMEWLDSRCPMASYAMKIDTDMFLNVHNLVDMLLSAPKDSYMTGRVALRGEVIRDKDSKWFLPCDSFAESHYPPYAMGGGYVFSSDLPRKFLEASRHVDAVYLEDVYLGLLMKHLGIPLTYLPFPSRNLF